MKILIVDYGMGNLASVGWALDRIRASHFVSSSPADIEKVDKIILPGVGSFRLAMENLTQLGWIEPLRHAVLQQKIPLMGICLGMQLLADVGFEDGETQGLGLIHGEVIKIKGNGLQIPHIGWNNISTPNDSWLSAVNQKDFYFIHSYHFRVKNPKEISATVEYGETLVAAVQSENIFGTQFHPEKSHFLGIEILKNFSR